MGLSSLKKGVGERDCNDKWPFMKNSQVVSKQSHDFKKRSSESQDLISNLECTTFFLAPKEVVSSTFLQSSNNAEDGTCYSQFFFVIVCSSQFLLVKLLLGKAIVVPFWFLCPLISTFLNKSKNSRISHCLKITQNVAFEFLNFGIFHQFLSY